MAVISFLFHLLGAVFLLLYAVRMVRTGIERAFGAHFKRVFLNSGGRLRSAVTGVCLAMILQSSAAVTLLATGFSVAGLVALPSALAIVLGADIGSAFLIQILAHPQDWLVPVLLTCGAGLFIKTERRSLRQAGRIILGVAFILIALQFLRDTMDPIRSADFLPGLAAYLEGDAITAFLAGAALAWLMHSSLAIILMCVALVSVGAFPLGAGLSLLLGANLGSAMIPVWLTRTDPRQDRRVPVTILVLRGGWAIVALGLVQLVDLPAILARHAEGFDLGQVLVFTHIGFNLALICLLPILGPVAALAVRLLPEPAAAAPAHAQPDAHLRQSLLDANLMRQPRLALSSLRREVLRMQELSAEMFSRFLSLYETGERRIGDEIIALDKDMNNALDGVRHFGARIDTSRLDEDERQRVGELVEYAIALESAADVVSKRLVPRAVQKAEQGIALSAEGAAELGRIQRDILASFPLAAAVLLDEDTQGARSLLAGKEAINRAERQSRQLHLQRLHAGSAQSFESSNLHLETLKALKDFNSLLASVAYPILQRAGQLRDTRLIGERELA